jgi:hypothetical protein
MPLSNRHPLGLILADSSSTASCRIWTSWNNSITSTAATTADLVWVNWNSSNAVTSGSVYQGNLAAMQGYYAPSQDNRHLHYQRETPEQAQARVQQAAARREETLRIEGERAKAREKAEKLLRENLSPKQLEELTQHNYFRLETVQPDGSRRFYRINRGRARNVKEITQEGIILRTLCAHPVEEVPDADTMLAQKLWLETMEEEFRQIANFS